MSKLDPELRQSLWQALDKLSRQHRAFQDAKWALPIDDLDQIDQIAAKLQPIDPVAKTRFLFDDHLPDIGTRRSDDVVAYEAMVREARMNAVRAIVSGEGLLGVQRLVDSTKVPIFVGLAVADAGVDIDVPAVLADLDSQDRRRVDFAFGFVRQRISIDGLAWVESVLPQLAGRPLAQARVLRASSEFATVWDRAAKLGKTVEAAYWSEFMPVGLGPDFPLLSEAARHLLDHGRAGTASDLLALYAERTGAAVKPEVIAETLEALVAAPPEEQRLVSPYELQRLLEVLRSSDLDEDRLASLEWQLLPGLGYDVPAPTLERRLARDPDFFVELLSMCFKRADGSTERQPHKEAAQNAYRLLDEWQILPGSTERGGQVDEAQLNGWIDKAFRLLAEADRTEIGGLHIGRVFAHAKEDQDGTWPTEPVRNVIDRLGRDEVERGFASQIYNNRGGTTRSLTDGGKQEYELADRFERWEARIRDGWPRTAAVLRSLAHGYRAQGQVEDEEAERFKKGLDP